MDILTRPAAHTALYAPRHFRSLYAHYHDDSSTSSSSPDLTHDHTDDPSISPESEGECVKAPDTIVPKIEEQDDDHHALASLTIDSKPHMVTDIKHELPPATPRKRGRPRKHPVVEQKKTTHARSKTGCGTCRKRKKKCDETKPICLNCAKNNVVCDGYEPAQPWRPGKQKALGQSLPLPPLQFIDGMEWCDTDSLCFDYFHHQMSKVLSLTDNGCKPFARIIISMAREHVSLMHSVLHLAGGRLLEKTPRGGSQWQSYSKRIEYYSENTLAKQIEDIKTVHAGTIASNAISRVDLDLLLARTLVLCLQAVSEGDTSGQAMLHLNCLKELLVMQTGPSHRTDLRGLVLEFVLYHDHSAAITNLGYQYDTRSKALMEDFSVQEHTPQSETGNVLAVRDGIFQHITRIRRLRDIIREQRKSSSFSLDQWWADEGNRAETLAIDKALRQWHSNYPEGTARHTASRLYTLCTWIYLKRTTHASRASPVFREAVDRGLALLRQVSWAGDDGSMPSILLMPLFLLGCAAFEPCQRPEILDTFQRLQNWSSLGNIAFARDIVREIWARMDRGQEQESWDWERLLSDRQWDLLIT